MWTGGEVGMIDSEKVMTGLELCTNISQDGCLMLCPYKDENDETYSGFCEQVLKQDALELIEEQEKEIENLKEIIKKADHTLEIVKGKLNDFLKKTEGR